jgi:hypothetical protein
MRNFMQAMRREWRFMFSPPWQPRPRLTTRERWGVWLGTWLIALIGLVGGAIAAPAVLAAMRLTHSPFYDWMLIAIAVVAGILVQMAMTGVAGASNALEPKPRPDLPRGKRLLLRLRYYVFNSAVVILGAILVARYLDWIQSEQRAITIAFVGALLVKSIVLPGVKTLIMGKAAKRLWHWIQDADKTNV